MITDRTLTVDKEELSNTKYYIFELFRKRTALLKVYYYMHLMKPNINFNSACRCSRSIVVTAVG